MAVSQGSAGRNRDMRGFTLVELLMVIIILGFMVGMVMPFANRMDDDARRKQTRNTFEEIRMAVLGPRAAFDEAGNRVIGGFVGDLGHLPRLYVYEWDGSWVHPDVNACANNVPGTPDTVGDQQAQPAALWCDHLADVDNGSGVYVTRNLPETQTSQWKGPYMATPADAYPDDQVRTFIVGASGAAENNRSFCLRETAGRLSDGWGRALIIYARDADADGSPDLDANNSPLNLVFVSAGPDARYDASDPADKSLSGNSDNLVMEITESEWDDSPLKTMQTINTINRIRRALVGRSPGDINDGFTGDMGRLPKLFRWETTDWDDEDGASTAYTKGQPRELWTAHPAPGDDVETIATPGFGWDRPYLTAPHARDEAQVLTDAWGREILFFTCTDESMLVASGGADGSIDVYNATGGVPSDTETVDLSRYEETGHNIDNITTVIRPKDWDEGRFQLNQLIVHNASKETEDLTTATFYYGSEQSVYLECSTANGFDSESKTWTLPSPAFDLYDVTTGSRELIIRKDINKDGTIDPGESFRRLYNVITTNSLEPRDDVEVSF